MQLLHHAKLNEESIKLTPVFVTKKDEEEYHSLYNKNIKEIVILIFQIIDNFDDEKAKKNKKKEKHRVSFQSI